MLCEVCIGAISRRQNLLFLDTTTEPQSGRDISEKAMKSWMSNGQKQSSHPSRRVRFPFAIYGHHSTSRSLALSAAAGCHICLPLWGPLSPSEQQYIKSMDNDVTVQSTADSNGEDQSRPNCRGFLSYLRLYRPPPSEEDYALHAILDTKIPQRVRRNGENSFLLRPGM
jgi:hypothetical protein